MTPAAEQKREYQREWRGRNPKKSRAYRTRYKTTLRRAASRQREYRRKYQIR